MHAERWQQPRVDAPFLHERKERAEELARLRCHPIARHRVVDVEDHDKRRLAMISRIISDVPDAIVQSRTSRKKPSTGNSRM